MNYAKQTVPQLKLTLQERGLKFSSKTRKPDLVAMLNEADKDVTDPKPVPNSKCDIDQGSPEDFLHISMSDIETSSRRIGPEVLSCLLSAGQQLVGQGSSRSPGTEVGSSGREFFGALNSVGQNLVVSGHISPMVLEAGTILAQNWRPILSAGKAVLGAGGLVGVLGVGLTAGVAKLGFSLLERRLARTREERKAIEEKSRNPLRKVSSKSKTRTKHKVGKTSKTASVGQTAPL